MTKCAKNRITETKKQAFSLVFLILNLFTFDFCVLYFFSLKSVVGLVKATSILKVSPSIKFLSASFEVI